MRANRKEIAAILLFIALIVAFVLLINGITSKGSEREKKIVREAVKNAALTCYVVEGTYPDSLQYLRDNYHLAYNEEKYVVDYDWIGANIIPHIKVVERGSSGQ